jgi:hypothetical protein
MELAKFAPLIKGWPWPKLGYLLGVCLLYKHLVTFDQAVVLILLAVVVDRLVQSTTAVGAENLTVPGHPRSRHSSNARPIRSHKRSAKFASNSRNHTQKQR